MVKTGWYVPTHHPDVFLHSLKSPVLAPLYSSDVVLSGRLPRKDESHFIILPLVYPLLLMDLEVLYYPVVSF